MNKVKKFKMTEYIEANLKLSINILKTPKILTKLNKLSVIEEFKEWNMRHCQIKKVFGH